MRNAPARRMGARVVTLHEPGLAYSSTDAVRVRVCELLVALGLDPSHAGSPAWNPLGAWAPPGGGVVIKPNLVSSRDLHQKLEGERLEASSTHGSLLEAVLELALRAVGERGWVRVVDAPVEGCELEKVAGPLGIFDVIERARARGFDVAFIDLRTFRVAPRFLLDDVRVLGRSLNVGALVRTPLPGDPRGYAIVDLGEASAFAAPGAPPGHALRFHRSHYTTPVAHHTRGRHEYSLPRTVLAADLVVQLPKLKTHKKTGVTLALKSVIGLTNEKYWLPHFTEGDPSRGGDELAEPLSFSERAATFVSRAPLPFGHSLVARAPRVGAPPRIIDGSWEGNRTLYRTILDLYRAIAFTDREGVLRATPQRRFLHLVDGIVAGEGEGPMGATPVRAGLLAASTDAARVDEACARLIGFAPERIPLVREAVATFSPDPPEVVHLGPPFTHRFRAPRSWPSLVG
ncbi:MAG: DUF362 domain-containing protein [Polyangiaceae bacterium]